MNIKMKYVKHFAMVFTFVLFGFSGKIDNLPTIDIAQAFNKVQEIVLSDFVENLEYIVVESEKPIDGNLKVYSSGNYLICIARNQIYVFDKHTGKFIREIGRFGNGPGEYHNPIYFDSETKYVIASKAERLLEYDLNGKHTRTIIPPKLEDGGAAFSGGRLSGRILLDKNTVAYYKGNT